MTGSISGISSYQKANEAWQSTVNKNSEVSQTKSAESTSKKTGAGNVKVSEWNPISSGSSLIPLNKDGYGTVIGDAELSDKAKDYYDKLKSKYHGMDFILVSSDMKDQVAKNALAYGNSAKPVVLIDVDKIEQMATDENFRKKYESIIEGSQAKLLEMKNSLASTGAKVKNFGMSVSEDGKTSFFATLEKANEAQNKIVEKRRAEKKEAKKKEEKAEAKKAQAERIEKRKEEKEALKVQNSEDNIEDIKENKEYIEFSSESLDALLNKVSKYAYDASFENTLTEAEKSLGQNFDFKG